MPGEKAPEEQRKDQILRAALAVATRQRLEGLSTRAVTAEAGLSHGMVVVGFIEGCAVQAVIDPDRFDLDEFMASARALLAQLGVAERRRRPKAG